MTRSISSDEYARMTRGRMRVLVLCEYSGRVRDAFRAKGHYAVSCDLLPSEGDPDAPHMQEDVLSVLSHGVMKQREPAYDLVVAFPPCTHLAVSGARYFADKRADGRQRKAIELVRAIWQCNVPRVAIENPVGILNSYQQWPELADIDFEPELPRPYYIQPWEHGSPTQKKTGIWSRGLPKLKPSNIVEGRKQEVWLMGPSKDRAKKRSLTPIGIAEAMVDQWGWKDQR